MSIVVGVFDLVLLCSVIILFSSSALSHLKGKEEINEKPRDFYAFLFKGYY
jgi:hypothetical protein